MGKKKTKLTLEKKYNLTGWAFLLPAAILIFVFCFYPMAQAIILSFKKTGGAFTGLSNYTRVFQDKTFQQCLFNTFFYFLYPGADHADPRPDVCIDAEQQRSAFQGTVPYLHFPAVRNISRILRDDFPFPVRKRRFYQHRSPRPRHEPDHVVLQCVDSPCGYHHRPDLEMDGIQHGILSLRYAEH